MSKYSKPPVRPAACIYSVKEQILVGERAI